MLNRRILRIKAFKVLYSYAEDPSMSLKEAQAQLELSCKATRSLYLFMLAIIPALTEEARSRIEAARRKFNPTEEEKHPNLKFVENALAPILLEDPDFQKAVSREKLSWEQYDALLRKMFDSIRTKPYYEKYMSSPERSLAEDVRLFTRIYEEEFVDNTDLEDILEDLSIFWNDDLAYALTCCCRTLDGLAAGERWSLPPLDPSEMSGREGMDSAPARRLPRLRQVLREDRLRSPQVGQGPPVRHRHSAHHLRTRRGGDLPRDPGQGHHQRICRHLQVLQYAQEPFLRQRHPRRSHLGDGRFGRDRQVRARLAVGLTISSFHLIFVDTT